MYYRGLGADVPAVHPATTGAATGLLALAGAVLVLFLLPTRGR